MHLFFCFHGAYSLVTTFDTHKSIDFLTTSNNSQFKDSTGTVPKPNDTGCANYTGWNIKIIMHFHQPQHPYL